MTVAVGDLDESLDPKVLAKAMKIVKRDRAFVDVVDTVPFRLSGQGRWGQIDGSDLGVRLEMSLRRPLSVDAVLPSADIPPDAPTKGECQEPYRQTWRRYRARDVREILLLVDLRRRTVADIDTDASIFEIGRVPGRPYPSCAPR